MTAASKQLLFGTAGVPQSSSGPSTLEGIQRVSELGLDCQEVEFVKGIKLGSETAKKIRKQAEKLRIRLSVHAPYYINLNSPEEGKRLASQERLLSSARLAALCGAESVVFHPGYYGKNHPDEALEKIIQGISEVVSILKKDRIPAVLRPETMGKKSQFGTLEEILFLCRNIDGIKPCIDFSHIYAREGKVNSYNAFRRVFHKIEKKLGAGALQDLHIHISGIAFSDKGELKHLNLDESEFRYDEWVQTVRDLDVRGTVICESPHQEKDALMLKKLYHSG